MKVTSQYLLRDIVPPQDFIRTPVSVVLDENVEALLEERQKLGKGS